MQDLKIAAIQTYQIWEDKKANLNHFENEFEKIKEAVDLILLPEMFNTSFSMNTDLAEEMQGETVAWLKKWSLELNTAIAGTLMIKEKDKIFNRLVLVYQGDIFAQYNKIHLFRMAKENNHFSSGNTPSIIDFKGWKINLQICYDLRFPETVRNSSTGKDALYDLIIYLANWPSKRSYAWSNLLQARAIENQAYVIGLNRIGKDGNNIEYDG